MVIRSTIQQCLKQIFVASLNIFVINRNLSFILCSAIIYSRILSIFLWIFCTLDFTPVTERRNLREGYKSVMANPAASGNISSTSGTKIILIFALVTKCCPRNNSTSHISQRKKWKNKWNVELDDNGSASSKETMKLLLETAGERERERATKNICHEESHRESHEETKRKRFTVQLCFN